MLWSDINICGVVIVLHTSRVKSIFLSTYFYLLIYFKKIFACITTNMVPTNWRQISNFFNYASLVKPNTSYHDKCSKKSL